MIEMAPEPFPDSGRYVRVNCALASCFRTGTWPWAAAPKTPPGNGRQNGNAGSGTSTTRPTNQRFFPAPPTGTQAMIELRELRDEDIAIIKAWPLYPEEFSDLDYSLRDGGWLDEFLTRNGTELLLPQPAKRLPASRSLHVNPVTGPNSGSHCTLKRSDRESGGGLCF